MKKLAEEQLKIFKYMEETTDNLFILGKAGTGKSELLKYMIRNTSKTNVVLASTGVASLNVEGSTIHSFFHLKPTIQDMKEIKRKNIYNDLVNILKELDTLFIDEVSIIHPDTFDAINIMCQRARGNRNPFGGIQLILFGDLYQLSPVIRNDDVYNYYKEKYNGIFFFNAESFKNCNFKYFELEEIHRQKDINFIDILNKIRIGDVSESLIKKINERVSKTIPQGNIITLATKNFIVDDINNTELKKLEGREYVYTAQVKGDMNENYFPTSPLLHLKVGAKIMMLTNTSNWVNGSLGIITKLTNNSIEVEVNNKRHRVHQHTWKNYAYTYDDESKSIKKEVISTFTQYPIRLAYAITIHKSQGKTLNNTVLIDFDDGAFAEGQVYVALSRCSSLDNLYLKQPLHMADIKVNQEVVNFMENIKIIKFNDNGKENK